MPLDSSANYGVKMRKKNTHTYTQGANFVFSYLLTQCAAEDRAGHNLIRPLTYKIYAYERGSSNRIDERRTHDESEALFYSTVLKVKIIVRASSKTNSTLLCEM